MNAPMQQQVNAVVEEAYQTKLRCGCSDTAAVYKYLNTGRRCRIGFNFRQNVRVGDVFSNEDGSVCEVVALV